MKTNFSLLSAISALVICGVIWLHQERLPSAAPSGDSRAKSSLQEPARPMALPVLSKGKPSDLPVTAAILWEKKSSVPAMAVFQEWAQDFIAKPAPEKIAAGVKAAVDRRVEMKRLIRENPEQALQGTVPETVRQMLPAEVRGLLEERVDVRGDLRVTGATFLNGKLPEGKPAITTQALLDDGRRMRAFTYGKREMEPTQHDVPVHGVAVDGLLAVSEHAARVLEPVEVKQARADAVPYVAEEHAANPRTTTLVRVGRETRSYCCDEHVAGLFMAPQVEQAASGGSETSELSPGTLSRAPTGWTTGKKRVLAVRVEFTSETGNSISYHGLTDHECREIVRRMGDFFKNWSFGRLEIAEFGNAGSALGPTVMLSKAAEDYDGDEMSDIWSEVWSKMEVHGYTEDEYPFLLVLAGPAPFTDEESPWDAPTVVTWAGRGLVGEGAAVVRTGGTGLESDKRIDANVNVALHELGHNFGLRHASSMIPMPVGSPFEFATDEYGDLFDSMGLSWLDFNARSKHWLRWMDNASLPVVKGSGVFTLKEHDLGENAGVRGLQVRTDLSKEDIFIDYRLRYIEPHEAPSAYVQWDNQIRAYGAGLRLARRDSPRSWLLDATPETPNGEFFSDGSRDSLLLPGRTFGIGGAWITTLAADPEAGQLTVEVQRSVPGNTAPAGRITLSSPVIGQGEKLFLTAEATDPENDDLAYHWQVPGLDGEDVISRAVFPNRRTLELEFPTTGIFQVLCMVSDKHGGTATLPKLVIVTPNEAPTITAITDKVMDEDTILNVPFVIGDPTSSPDSLNVTATSSDMTLIHTLGLQITGTGANKNLSIAPRSDRHGSAEITLSVSDGELTTVESFRVTVRPVSHGSTLVAAGSADWRYWAEAVPPADGWHLAVYDDRAWPQSNARFTYPSPGFNIHGWTVLPTAAGRVTSYFRRSFMMPQFTAGELMLRLICDDGAVIYMNGVEVHRHNLPQGRISSTTRALSSKEGALETEVILIPVAASRLIHGGENVIAVVVHDSGGVRSPGDVEFDLEIALADAPVVSNIDDITIQEDEIAGPIGFTASDFEAYGSVSISVTSSNEELLNSSQAAVEWGKDDNFQLTLTPEPDATGSAVVTVKVSDGSSATWRSFMLTVTPVNDLPQMAALSSRSAAVDVPVLPIQLVVNDVDHAAGALSVAVSSSNTALLPNSAMQILSDSNPALRWLQLNPLPGVLGETTLTLTVGDGVGTTSQSFIFRTTRAQLPGASDSILLPALGFWKCLTQDLPTGLDGHPVDFTTRDFDDKEWDLGSARLYRDKTGASNLGGTPNRITTYFRSSFEIGSPASISQLKLSLMRDDGAAVYLNGTRVWISNLPDIIEPQTLALSDIDREDESVWHHLNLPPTHLVPGRNVIAVELHQSVKPTTAAEQDYVFDFQLSAVPAAASTPLPTTILIPAGDFWSYWDHDVYNVGPGWRDPAADDSSWSRGFAAVGYGYATGIASTVVNRFSGNGETNRSVLFRKKFDVADPSACTALHLFMRMDDGAAVYLNGKRIVTQNVRLHFYESEPDGHPLPKALAVDACAPDAEGTWHHFLISPADLVAGRNHLAVSVHQAVTTFDKLLFDLQLTAELKAQPQVAAETKAGKFSMQWSAAYLGWQLQKSSDLVNWSNVGSPLTLDGATLRYQEAMQGAQCFYRLVAP